MPKIKYYMPTTGEARKAWNEFLTMLKSQGLEAGPERINLLREIWYNGYQTGADHIKEGKLII